MLRDNSTYRHVACYPTGPCNKTVDHAQLEKREKKTKMADDGRVCVDSKQSVLKIHEKLRKEVHKIAEKKSWSAEQKEEFEEKILGVGR